MRKYLLCGILCLAPYKAHGQSLAPVPRDSAVATVEGFKVTPGQGRVDIQINAGAVQVRDYLIDTPERLVLDLTRAQYLGVPREEMVGRGGVRVVRISQLSNGIVRVVVELGARRPYEVQKDAAGVLVTVFGTDFARSPTPAAAPATLPHPVLHVDPLIPEPPVIGAQRITVTYQGANIHDVIDAFATFARRTIIVGRGVNGTINAHIRNQPWDLALRSILEGQGLTAVEDPKSGIIMVESNRAVQLAQATEPLITRLVNLNYAKADSLVPVVRSLLARDCMQADSATGSGNPTCITRGAVAANQSTNTLIVTETPDRMVGILDYVSQLDVRTPQVAIVAKIVFVDRTTIENLGLSYDIGNSRQYSGSLVQRTGQGNGTVVQPGNPGNGGQVLLGGNTFSGVANASNRIIGPALQLVYSFAVGHGSVTAFIDALQERRLADLQAEPSIVTVDNRQAQIQVGQDIPVRVLDAGTASLPGIAGTAPKATVSFHSVGIILQVTPHITQNGQVILDVHAENSDAQLAGSDIGYIFNKQSADNRLLVADGQTAVIGGLTVKQLTKEQTGIPGLVDLPVVGRLFGVNGKSETKRDLLILITPHVLDPVDR